MIPPAMKRPLARSPNLWFSALLVILLVFGGWLGHALAGRAELAIYKLLNILGIIYGLLGIVVLSEFVVRSDPLKSFMVQWVATAVAWAHSIIPIGALVGVGMGYQLSSAGITAKFFLGLLAYSIPPLLFVEMAVFNPRLKVFAAQPIAVRNQIFGLALLISGMIVQLIAALQDFNG